MSEPHKFVVVRGQRIEELSKHELHALLNQLEGELPLRAEAITRAQLDELETVERELERRR